MASGSAGGRAKNSGSKGGFDFGSDDILCSYEDFDNNHHDSSNGTHSDPVIGTNSTKDFQKSRVSRSPVFPTSNIYSQPEDSLNQEVIATVENTMKKYSDNLMRFLEGISSRLSQLELYCYNLDKSIGEMRSELAHDNKEADAKLKSLDKHLQEVHRSVQILRDKQELADTQKELAKLQLAQKESSRSQQDEKSTTPASEPPKSEDRPEIHNQQLALALPHQVAPQPSLPTRATEQQQPVSIAASSQMASQTISQQPPYYLPATQLPNPAAQPQPPQGPYVSAAQPQPPQGPYVSAAQPQPQPQQGPYAPNPQQGQVNQPPQVQQFPQYQQQWSQPPVQPAQQQLVQSQTQIRAPQNVYPAYMQNQSPNPPPQEQLTSSMPMQMPPPGVPQQGLSRADGVPYSYGGPGRPLQAQPPPQPMKGGDGYPAPGGSYMMYDGEGGRSHHAPPTHFSQGGYSPTNAPIHNPQPPTSAGHMMRGPSPPQFVRNHPYNELIDKLVSMGYRGDHVASVIQRLEESGQPVDFNAVLDRLNGHTSGGSQRSW